MTFPPTCPWCCSTWRLGVICRHPEAAQHLCAVRASIHPWGKLSGGTGGAQAASDAHENESNKHPPLTKSQDMHLHDHIYTLAT